MNKDDSIKSHFTLVVLTHTSVTNDNLEHEMLENIPCHPKVMCSNQKLEYVHNPLVFAGGLLHQIDSDCRQQVAACLCFLLFDEVASLQQWYDSCVIYTAIFIQFILCTVWVI